MEVQSDLGARDWRSLARISGAALGAGQALTGATFERGLHVDWPRQVLFVVYSFQQVAKPFRAGAQEQPTLPSHYRPQPRY